MQHEVRDSDVILGLHQGRINEEEDLGPVAVHQAQTDFQ